MVTQKLAERLLAEEEREHTRKLAQDLHLEVPKEWTQAPLEGADRPIYLEGVLEMIALLRAHYPDLKYEILRDTIEDGRRVHHIVVETSGRQSEVLMS